MRDDKGQTPNDIRDPRRPEHLLVWALRAIAVGHGDCPRLRRAFEAACGSRGDHALMAYFGLVRNIGMTGRRRLRLHTPGCVCLSSDETRLRAHLRWLVEDEPDPTFIHAARVVAHILEVNGQRLPLRVGAPAPADADPVVWPPAVLAAE